MLFEYYSIRIKDAEPGTSALHVTPHYDEVHSSIKHFKEKHPDKKIVAYKHELKKGPMGMSHNRKVMFGKDKDKEKVTEMFADQGTGSSEKDNKEWLKKFARRPNDNVISYHRVSVTVSDPRHTMVTKRKEQVQKFVRVQGDKAGAVNKAKAHYKNKGYKVHSAEYIESFSKEVSESTKSFKTLMRSIEDKKSIKNLKVPSPAERKETEQPKKVEPVKESAQPKMGKTVHSVKHGEDEWTIHDMNSPRSTSAFKVRKNGKLQGNFAGRLSAHAYLKSRTQNMNESFTHMVHVQGNLDNPSLEKHMRSSNGDYHQETDKGSSYKFKNKHDAEKFQAGIKTTKDIYAGDVYRLNSNKG